MSRYIQLTIRLDDEGIDVAANSELKLYRKAIGEGYSEYLFGAGSTMNLLPHPSSESSVPSLNGTVVELEVMSNQDGAFTEEDVRERLAQERMRR